MPLSTIFQLYRESPFYWWRKLEYKEKTTELPQAIDKLHRIMLYRVNFSWAGFQLTILVVMGTDCIYKSNCHTIMTTTASNLIVAVSGIYQWKGENCQQHIYIAAAIFNWNSSFFSIWLHICIMFCVCCRQCPSIDTIVYMQ